MSFFDRFKKPVISTEPQKQSFASYQIELSKPQIPTFKESTKGAWIEYGQDNSYPETLLSFLETSSLHNGIVQGKSYLISGGEILIDGEPLNEIQDITVQEGIELKLFLNNYGESLKSLKSKLALDWVISGSFALEIIWSMDFSRIAKINYIPWSKLRPEAKDSEGKILNWYYSDNWAQIQKSYNPKAQESIRKIQSFNPLAQFIGDSLPETWKNNWNHNQLLFVKNHWPGYEYFGRPTYQGALTDIAADSKLSLFYLGAVENGFTPSVIITYTEPVGSDEEARMIGKKIEKEFTIKGAGRKIMLLFASSPETAPKIQPLDVKNLDQQMIALQEQLQNAIVTGHGIISPELVGVNVPGQLGGGELDLKWNIFYNNTIKKDREVIEDVFNQLAMINGIYRNISFEIINPLL